MNIIFKHKDGKIKTTSLKPGDTFFDTSKNKHYLIGRYQSDGIYYEIEIETGDFNALEERLVLKTNIEARVNES